MDAAAASLCADPNILKGWEEDLRVLKACANEQEFNARVAFFEVAARRRRQGSGGQWSEDVLDALLEAVRQDSDWPIRPSAVPNWWGVGIFQGASL